MPDRDRINTRPQRGDEAAVAELRARAEAGDRAAQQRLAELLAGQSD